jgi:hypothetical protein
VIPNRHLIRCFAKDLLRNPSLRYQLEIVHLALSAELSKELTDHYNRR